MKGTKQVSLFVAAVLCPAVGLAFASLHGDVEGQVRDAQGRLVTGALVSFSEGEMLQDGHTAAIIWRLNITKKGEDDVKYWSISDKKSTYKVRLPPGDYEVRARWSEVYYGQVLKIHVSANARVAQDVILSKIEPDWWKFRGQQGRDVCAAENVVNKSWDVYSEESNRKGISRSRVEYEQNVGQEFMQSAEFMGRTAYYGDQKWAADREAEYFFCARQWLSDASRHGAQGLYLKLKSLDEEESVFYWLTFSTYYYGAPVNYALALDWARKGAVAGFVRSMYDLGKYYRDGKATEKDLKESFKWLKAASDGGCKPAMSVIAEMYESGEGVDKDQFQAAFWRDLLGLPPGPQLSRSDVARLQQLATAWRPTGGKGKCIESTATTGTLPIQLRPTGTVGSNPVLTITNASSINWQIAFSGPSQYNVSLAPRSAQTITLTPGTYFISGQTGSASVIPFSPANYNFPQDVTGTFTITVQ